MKINANTIAVMAAILYAIREQAANKSGDDCTFEDAANDAVALADFVAAELKDRPQ